MTTILKAIARAIMSAVQITVVAVFVVPICLPIYLLVRATRAIDRIDLWANYDGDEKARDRARWRSS